MALSNEQEVYLSICYDLASNEQFISFLEEQEKAHDELILALNETETEKFVRLKIEQGVVHGMRVEVNNGRDAYKQLKEQRR